MHVGTCEGNAVSSLYLLNDLHSFTWLHHVLWIQALVTEGFFALKVLLEGNEAVVPSPRIIPCRHQYALAKERLGSSWKFPLRWMSPRGSAAVSCKSRRSTHVLCLYVCPCHLLGRCRGLVLSWWRNHAEGTLVCLTRSKCGGRRQIQTLKPQKWEGFFRVPGWNQCFHFPAASPPSPSQAVFEPQERQCRSGEGRGREAAAPLENEALQLRGSFL